MDKEVKVFGLSEQANADRLIYHYGSILKYNFTEGCWFIWNGKVWQTDEKAFIFELCKKTVKIIKTEAHALDKSKEEDYLNFYRKCLKHSAYTNIAEIAKSEPQVAALQNYFDGNPNQLNLQNGTFDLKEMKFKAHDPLNMITKIVDYSYQPNAECPAWNMFLSEIFLDNHELIRFIQKLVGYSLTGNTDLQRVIFCYGSGANGKSVFFAVMAMLLGDYYQKAPLELIIHSGHGNSVSNDVARLAGARVAVLQEIPEGKRINESKLKDLSGGDRITARFLFKDYFEFTPQCKIWFYGNHKPKINGTDEGIWRRIIMIPFVYTVPEEKRRPMSDMLFDFMKELPGIFNWALAGLVDYYENGLSVPTVVNQAMTGYRNEQDILKSFLDDSAVCDEGLKIKQKSLYESYCRWSEQFGDKPMSARRFSDKMKEKGFENQRGSGGAYEWIGVDITPHGEEVK